MWDTVRRELAHLQWDVEPPLTLDLMADWTRTVHTLVAIRRALGPVPAHDPVALLATATTGAMRTPGVRPTLAPSLDGVGDALAGVARDLEAASGHDGRREVATLNQVAYELAHWVRVRTPDDRAKTWLLAGETALDSAIHAPAGRSAAGVGLAAWQDTLAAVQPVQDAAIVRRSVALGHLAILRDAHALVGEARQSGALPEAYSDALLGSIRDLARAHQTTLGQIDGRHLGASSVDQAVMLKVGLAVRQLTRRLDINEPAHVRLDALLRSSLGEAVLVANLTQDAAAKPVAANISRLALEYLANPGILRPPAPPGSLPTDRPADPPPATVREPSASAPASASLGEPSIRPGTVLEGHTILALCRARDLGVAAASADLTHPPEILRGIDPSRWPQLVVEGRQAVTDLVASVIPMAYAQTRGVPNAADVRGQMFVELMGAAHLFDPQRTSPERWPKYAWTTLEHSRWRGVDDSGVVRPRSRVGSPRQTTVALAGIEPASRAPAPDAGIEQREAIKTLAQAVEQLPPTLREPLVQSMQGHSTRAIAEDIGVSESTARRRIQQARDHIREELSSRAEDGPWTPLEKAVADPVLERSQRLYEQTFASSLRPEPDRDLHR